MKPTQPPERFTELARRLARLDGVRDCGPPPPGLPELKAELDGLLSVLAREVPFCAYESEEACRRVTERVCALGREPSFAAGRTATQGSTAGPETDLGRIGNYRLLAPVGRGGMGTVYKALHTRLDKVVALKILPEGGAGVPEVTARFEREMKAVGRLEHAHLVRALDAGEADGRAFLVMEYLEGRTAAQLLREHGPLPVGDACEIARQAALGLQAIHEHGMVHRDVKPANLMLTPSGTVKILDLGLALLDSRPQPPDQELTRTGQVMGTPDYMAPEQCRDSHAVDIRSDLYALGVTLYKLLCGETPAAGERSLATGKRPAAAWTGSPPSIGAKRMDLPVGLVALVDRLLDRDPAGRPPSPGAVAEALAPFAAGHHFRELLRTPAGLPSRGLRHQDSSSTLPAPVTAPTARFPKVRRSRLAVLWLGLATAACVAGVAFFLPAPGGFVHVHIEDPEIQVSLKGSGIRLAGPGVKPLHVEPGPHVLHIRRGAFQLETDQFIYKQGDRLLFRVDYARGTLTVTRNGQPLGGRRLMPPEAVTPSGDAVPPKNGQELPPTPAPAGRHALLCSREGEGVSVPTLRLKKDGPLTVEGFVRIAGSDLAANPMLFGVRYHFALQSNISRWCMLLWTESRGEAPQCEIIGGDPIGGGRWIHVAGVRDHNECRLYLDGELIARRPVAGPLGNPDKTFALGESFDGMLAEVRVSNVARYDKSFTPRGRFLPDKDTVALYHLDDGQGDVIRDSSGNGHHGKIGNARWVKLNEPQLVIDPSRPTLTPAHGWVELLPLLRHPEDSIMLNYPLAGARVRRGETGLKVLRLWGMRLPVEVCSASYELTLTLTRHGDPCGGWFVNVPAGGGRAHFIECQNAWSGPDRAPPVRPRLPGLYTTPGHRPYGVHLRVEATDPQMRIVLDSDEGRIREWHGRVPELVGPWPWRDSLTPEDSAKVLSPGAILWFPDFQDVTLHSFRLRLHEGETHLLRPADLDGLKVENARPEV